MGLLLHDDGAGGNPPALGNVADFQSHQVVATKLAVDSEVEKGKLSHLLGDLQAGADRPNLLELERQFLANESALVPRGAGFLFRGVRCVHEKLLTLC